MNKLRLIFFVLYNFPFAKKLGHTTKKPSIKSIYNCVYLFSLNYLYLLISLSLSLHSFITHLPLPFQFISLINDSVFYKRLMVKQPVEFHLVRFIFFFSSP